MTTRLSARSTGALLLSLGSFFAVSLLASPFVAYASSTGAATFYPAGQCVDGTYVVPLGITRLHVVAEGGQGGNGFADPQGRAGGVGGPGTKVVASVPVTPGQLLYVNVADAYAPSPPAGSGSGGGPGGSTQDGPVNVGGGGDLATWMSNLDPQSGGGCAPPLSSLLVVAAGGGGGGGPGTFATGGNGGTETSSNGAGGNGGQNHQDDGAGGNGATSTSAGTGGAAGHGGSCRSGTAGMVGSQMQGGYGGDAGSDPSFKSGCQGAQDNSGSGGGGGGGYWGGGGGGGGDDNAGAGAAAGGGGGAGSSYIISGATLDQPLAPATSSLGRVIDGANLSIVPYDTAPAIISGNSFTFVEGTPSNFNLQATGWPVPSITVSQLPSNVFQHDNGDGTVTINGNPSAFSQGILTATLTATNTDGNGVVHQATQSVTFIVENGPSFSTPSDSTYFTVGNSASFALSCYGAYPAPTLSVTGILPPGISLVDNHNCTGSLSGKATAGGIYNVVVHAVNAFGTASENVTITVSPIPVAITITPNANPAAPDSTVYFTAHLSPAPSNMPYVQFLVDNEQLAYVNADASGNAMSPAVYTLGPGFHTITATMLDDGDFPSVSTSITEHIAVTSSTQTGTTIAASPANNALYFSDGRIFSHATSGDVNLQIQQSSRSAFAVDTAGDIYFFQPQSDGQILLARQSASGTITTGNLPLTAPVGLVLDGAGNAYVAQGGNNNVIRFAPDFSGTALLGDTPPYNSGGNYLLSGIAVDAAQNVFVIDGSGMSDRVLEVSSPYTFYPAIVATGFSNLTAIAADASDNLFVADASTRKIYRISTITSQQTVVASNLANVDALVVDAAGNLFAGSPNGVYEIAAPYTGSPVQIVSGHTVYALATVSLPSVTFGSPLTLTSTALPAPAGAILSGSVVFKESGATLGSGALNASGVASFTTSSLSIGQHLITATYGGSTGFPASTSMTLPVTVRPIAVPVTVTGTRTYGSSAVTYSFAVGTLPGGITGVTGTLATCATTTTTTTNIGSYPATISGCSGLTPTGSNVGNYAVNYIDGGVTVSPATIPIKVTGNRVVGSAITFSYAPVGALPSGIAITGTLSGCQSTVPGNAAVGTYDNTISGCGGLSPAGSRAANYTLSYIDGGVTVVLPTIAVTVTGTRPFGGGVTPTFTATPPGTLPYGVTAVSGALTGCTSSLSVTQAAGTYPSTISGCGGLTLSGPSASGYTISYVDGGFTITPRSVVVQVSGSQLPGGTPVFRFTPLNGFPTDVSFFYGSVTGCTTTVASSAAPGLYTNTISGCTGLTVYTSDGVNYSVTYSDMGFTVAAGPTSTSLVAAPVTAPDLVYAGNNDFLTRLPPPYSTPNNFNNFVQAFGVGVLSDGSIVSFDQTSGALLFYTSSGAFIKSTPIVTPMNALAIDSHDNIFGVTDDTSSVIEYSPPYTGAPVTVATGLYQVFSIAIDAADNLFVADRQGTFINMLSPPYTGSPIVVAQTLLGGSLAVDGAGNLYITTRSNGPGQPAHVNRLATPYNGVASNITSSLGLSNPENIVVDALGNLLISDETGVFEVTAAGVGSHPNSSLQGSLQLSLTRPATTVAVGATVTLTATVASTAGGAPAGSVTFFDGTTSIGTATLSGTPATATFSTTTLSQGTHFITAQFGATSTYSASTSPKQQVVVGTASPTIAFGAAPTIAVDGTGTVTATATSGLAVSFATTSSTCSVTTAGVVTGLSFGTCTITASQAGDATHLAAVPATLNLSVGKGAQAIVFGTAPSIGVGDSASVSATGGASGDPVVFGTTSTACTVTPGGLVTGISVGSCVVVATQVGNANYLQATPASQTITIAAAAQAIVFGAAPSIAVGGAGTVFATGGASGNGVTFSTTSASCSVTSLGMVTGLAAGNCEIDAAQAGNANYAAGAASQTFAIAQANQTISFASPGFISVGGSESLSATASSGLAVSFATNSSVCAVSPTGSLTALHAGNCIVSAIQTGNADFTAAPTVMQTIAIAPGTQTIAFGAAPAVSVGTAATAVASGGASGNPVTFSGNSTTCSVRADGAVTGLSVGTCVVTASQAGNTDYAAAMPVSLDVNVAQGAQTIAFGAAPVLAIGRASTITATASSGLAVTFGTSSSACLVSATGTVTPLLPGTCVVSAYQNGNDNYATAPAAAESLVVHDWDLSISVDDGTAGTNFLVGGAHVTYTITVQNLGDSDAVNATVLDALPVGLSAATWTCIPSGNALCSASGTGAIDDVVSLPVGSQLVYTLTATVQKIPEQVIVNTATVTVAASEFDAFASDNTATATDNVGIFSSGFDANGN